jgi:hypothetical protein
MHGGTTLILLHAFIYDIVSRGRGGGGAEVIVVVMLMVVKNNDEDCPLPLLPLPFRSPPQRCFAELFE